MSFLTFTMIDSTRNMIDCTRKKVVKMRKKVSGVYRVIFFHISNISSASMVLFRQWFLWWVRIGLLSAISQSIVIVLPKMAL